MTEKKGPAAFSDFERRLHERLMQFERDVVREELVKLDVDADAVVIDGKVHRRVLRQSQAYMTAAGEVSVERTLYKDRSKDGDGRAVSPLELTIGVVGGFWTPRAAQQTLWVVAQMTPAKGEQLFERLGAMDPSKASLDRLPKLVSERWERHREELEAALRGALVIPEGTASIAVSLDGVMAPLDDEGQTAVTERREQAAREGRVSKGPLGYREVGCATLSFCDERGDMIGAVRMARAPEANKRTLKAMLAAELRAELRARPGLKLVKVADATEDNWTFLGQELPEGEEVIDFFHAAERLHAAVAEAYGDGTRETQYRYETLREQLRDVPNGVEQVINALKYLHQKHPRREVIRQSLGYFRSSRRRMQYAAVAAKKLPIGSGVVEAACKTLVTQRMKNSGMRWSAGGAQAILTPRGWDQSERFDEAWALVAALFHAEVTVLANVVAIKPNDSRAARKRASR